MKTKILALLLALVMVMSMLVACKDDSKTPGDDTDDSGSTPDDPGNHDGPGGDDGDAGYKWKTTPLIFEMTDNSNQEELPSGCKRYLAGEDENFFENIDTMIAERNDEAYATTKVEVTYTYLPDTTEYGWGANIETIFNKCTVHTEQSPDMFCNFVYDMVSTSLKGAFANLYSKERGTGLLEGANYFDFAENGFQDSGEGYMFEYMKSLTLSKHKMYCLSSDYCTDMVRAFFAVPVNINLINGHIDVSAEEGKFNSDRTGDGKFNIDDFYQLVRDGQWNYEALAGFSEMIYADEGSATEGKALDDLVGFALSSSSGLSSSGMLYTTSVKIISRDWDEAKNDYVYSYPETNEDLYKYCENLKVLFDTTGVISVSDSETLGFGPKSLQAIRNRFAENKVLFGGVICIGSLEYEEYQNMNETTDGGFGVAPAPLYRTVNPETGEPDLYQTQIHNIGRIIAINNTTEKFAQCSAFLNYQSNNSTKILNEYYDYKLQYDIAGGTEGNIEMLQYIRENVRSSFDKAYEDAIGKFFVSVDENSDKNKWHSLINAAKYQMTDMQTQYEQLRSIKEEYLKSLIREFDVLPN